MVVTAVYNFNLVSCHNLYVKRGVEMETIQKKKRGRPKGWKKGQSYKTQEMMSK